MTGDPGPGRGRAAAAAVVFALTASSCGVTSTDTSNEVLVSAAASLTDVFVAMAEAFESEHPHLEVVLNLGGSSALREQIIAGAPADVFAPADPSHMDLVAVEAGVAREPRIFAGNHLQIAIPAANPGGVGGLDDFAEESLLIGLCAAAVPCGDLALRALATAGVTPAIDTSEPNVRALLTKIKEGELDAGIVYATDIAAAGPDVAGIDIDPHHQVEAEYPIAPLAGAPNPVGAAAFVDFVLSGSGRAILARHGFTSP